MLAIQMSVSFIRNIAFYKFRRKKIRLIIKLPIEEANKIISNHKIIPLSASVQKFYNGSSCAIDIHNSDNLEEIIDAFKILIEKQST